jgi:hypothetical protein
MMRTTTKPKATKPKERAVFWRLAPAIGLLLGLVPAPAPAQTNIDQGKTPAEIFANDCATCHKSARGLAKDRTSLGLASFLTEHYTSSREQAAQLAAYVMGAGGGEASPARGPKTPPKTTGDDTKPGARPGKPPGDTATAAPTAKPPPGALPSRRKPPDATQPSPQPTTAAAEPSAPSAPVPDTSPAAAQTQSAAAPANPDAVDAPVPRDDIPD